MPDGVDGAPTVTVDDLIPGAYDEARSRIPLPDPSAVAPPIEQGSLVNMPLWLAVVEPEPVSARAQVGSVWAQADATFVGLTWDMGTGDIVECDGAGDKWYPGATRDGPRMPPGGCGYNYEHPSTPEFTGDGNAYHVTVTAHWEVRITGSDGRDVVADPIDVTSEFDYSICEIHTVGTEQGAPSPTEGMTCREALDAGF